MNALLLAVLCSANAADVSWNQLHADHAKASSFLKSNWNKYNENYHPNYVLDDNPKTAWVEGVEGDGLGQTLSIPISALSSVRSVKVRIRNGYQKSEALFTANSVPKDVTFRLLDRAGGPVAISRVTLEKKMGWQEVELIVPGDRGVATVQLEVRSVYPGRSYQDTCISDIEIFADSDVTYMPAVEKGKKAMLDGWIGARVAQAKYFADLPAEYPFAHTAYRSGDDKPLDVAQTRAKLEPWTAKLDALMASETWFRGATTKALQRPDGAVTVHNELMPMFNISNTALFEAKKELAKHDKQEFDEEQHIYWESEYWRSNYKAAWADAERTKPQMLFFWSKRVVHERGANINDDKWLAVFDDNGRLTHTLQRGMSEDELGPNHRTVLIEYVYNDAGKVTKWVSTKLENRTDWETEQKKDYASQSTFSGS